MKPVNQRSRRAFLHSSGTAIALPFLESLSFGGHAVAAQVAPPKRMIFLSMGFGVTKGHWYPNIDETGTDYQLPEVLEPLAKHKGDFSIIQNLQHAHSRDGHWGSTFWLTGADKYAIPGRTFNNTVSVDQVAAEQFGAHTRFNAIRINSSESLGHGPGSLGWSRSGKPLPEVSSPVAMYHKLFSDGDMPLEQRQVLLKNKQSALDVVLADAKSVKRGLTKTDVDKLDEYFESIRDIETRIGKEESWLNVPKRMPKDPVKEPAPSLKGIHEAEVIYDLMAAAMQVDATRVFTWKLPGTSLMKSWDSSNTAHNVSHHGAKNSESYKDSVKRDTTHARLLAGFLDKLKATREADGSSLLDNVTLTFGSNIRVVHNLTNCPTLIAGGGAGFEQGRHLVMEKDTPLCNLWLSQLNGCGVDVDSFGDSTEAIQQLRSA